MQEIGRGAYSVCRKCVHKVSGEEYAVKVRNVMNYCDFHFIVI